MSAQQYEYCVLSWWRSTKSQGVNIRWLTEEGVEREDVLFQSPYPHKDMPKVGKAVGQTVARLGLEGWEAVHGEPWDAFFSYPEGGGMLFKRPIDLS